MLWDFRAKPVGNCYLRVTIDILINIPLKLSTTLKQTNEESTTLRARCSLCFSYLSLVYQLTLFGERQHSLIFSLDAFVQIRKT